MIRITEVLNYFKEPWYVDWVCRVGKREANRVSKAAMKVGSRVDEIIKESPHCLKLPKSLTPEVNNCMIAYAKWYEVYKPKSITPCTRLFATIEGQDVTGEPDLMVDDVLVDIKCSAKISPSYWVQVNMYRYLEFSEHRSWKKVGILRLDKVTASYEYVVQDYDANKVSVWCGLMRAYCYFNKERNDGDEL